MLVWDILATAEGGVVLHIPMLLDIVVLAVGVASASGGGTEACSIGWGCPRRSVKSGKMCLELQRSDADPGWVGTRTSKSLESRVLEAADDG